MKLYEYRIVISEEDDQYVYRTEGDEEWITDFISREEISELAGGFHVSVRPSESDDSDVRQFIGVHGKRECSKFRRVLRERGADFDVCRDQSWEERNRLASIAANRLSD